MKNSRSKILLSLFLAMFKIGLFTFGGGYAMISLIENEFVERKKWISRDEFFDMIAIAESTPGPIAINSATYIGYNLSGLLGSLTATVAVCIPSFVIIYVISLFFEAFLNFKYVEYAFRGIQVCVTYLILKAGIKMLCSLPVNAFNVTVFLLTAAAMIALSLFSVSFSSVFYILLTAVLSLFIYLVKGISVGKRKENK